METELVVIPHFMFKHSYLLNGPYGSITIIMLNNEPQFRCEDITRALGLRSTFKLRYVDIENKSYIYTGGQHQLVETYITMRGLDQLLSIVHAVKMKEYIESVVLVKLFQTIQSQSSKHYYDN